MSETARHMLVRIGFLLAGGFALLLAGILTGVVDAGPLEPDAAPASTDSVLLPGTPISELPFTIQDPGHYYLTRNLSTTTGHGIIVSDINVSVDLGGFTLAGNPNIVSRGVIVGGAGSTRVSVYNGTIRDFQVGISMGSVSDNRVYDVALVSNTTGITLGGSSIISDCIVSKGTTGILLLGQRFQVRDCNVNSTEVKGVWVLDPAGTGVIEGSTISGNNTLNDDFGGGMFIGQTTPQIIVRENEFAGNLQRDINIEGDNIVIIDNAIDCTGSVQPQPGADNVYAPINTTDPHTNRAHRASC